MASSSIAEFEYAFDEASLACLPRDLVEPVLAMGLKLRPLCASDYAKGHLELLSTLTFAPDIGARAWSDRFYEMKHTQATYYPLVIVDTAADRLVATGTLVVERKFLRSAGMVGHIEDISVSPSQQGKGLGQTLITALSTLSEELGCYKVSQPRFDASCFESLHSLHTMLGSFKWQQRVLTSRSPNF